MSKKKSSGIETHADKLKARREYYQRNIDMERYRSREYYKRKKETETAAEAEIRKEKHREAAARYRSTYRKQICIREWERRLKVKAKKQMDADEAEYQAFMAGEFDEK
ncbi:hypothetical protein CVT24_012283 [Panaeolus cyanescens]|uniref:Uncharacterized protein n=1 Tax=Panaeolus cyanescens TaxID=181874 RepID=A0A409WE09_9AGAR|nr:hypothetical protein CVT24_012283 [Panaeolus cyanescens]